MRVKLLLSALLLSALVAAPASALSISSFFGKGDRDKDVSFSFSLKNLFDRSSWDFDSSDRSPRRIFDLGGIGGFFSKFDGHEHKKLYYWKKWKSHAHCRGCGHDKDKPTPGIPEPTGMLVFGLGLGIVAGGAALRRRRSS